MIVPASDVRIVLSTAGSREEAERVAHALVDDGLAACVNLVPGLTSIYRWQGVVESADEVLLLIKTTAARLEVVEAALRAAHSYDVPELLVLTTESASEAYLAWLVQATETGRS
jgi:periplasmic divalent cation tolerance protein